MDNEINHPRVIALEELKHSISEELWHVNMEFIHHLKAKIKHHPMANNPMINVLNDKKFTHQALKNIHLEYRYAIVQIFTDALLMAQFQTRQLEPRLPAGTKMTARFLLTLNVLDEFGFQHSIDSNLRYQGKPANAHYCLFEQVLDELNIPTEERISYQPSPIAHQVRQYLEKSYNTYVAVVSLLAVAEQQVILYSPPLRQATKKFGLNVDRGYYYVHGISSDHTAFAADDEHENDLWFCLIQALMPDNHKQIESLCLSYCDLWHQFWLYQLKINSAPI